MYEYGAGGHTCYLTETIHATEHCPDDLIVVQRTGVLGEFLDGDGSAVSAFIKSEKRFQRSSEDVFEDLAVVSFRSVEVDAVKLVLGLVGGNLCRCIRDVGICLFMSGNICFYDERYAIECFFHK